MSAETLASEARRLRRAVEESALGDDRRAVFWGIFLLCTPPGEEFGNNVTHSYCNRFTAYVYVPRIDPIEVKGYPRDYGSLANPCRSLPAAFSPHSRYRPSKRCISANIQGYQLSLPENGEEHSRSGSRIGKAPDSPFEGCGFGPRQRHMFLSSPLSFVRF